MALIDRDAEVLRKQRLKELEDKRVRFAEKLDKDGFRPEKMLICSNETGGFIALARHNSQYAVIVAPAFGAEDDFIVEYQGSIQFRKEEVFIKSEGLGGVFGFGKKGASGLNLFITLSDGSEVCMPIVAGRTSFLETTLKKNPLLKTARRRGDANIIWDLQPIERTHVEKLEKQLDTYYLA